MRKHKHLKMSYNDTRKAIAELQDAVDNLLDIFITSKGSPEVRMINVTELKKLKVKYEPNPDKEEG